MGVRISFISATQEELDRAYKDPEWAHEFIGELYSDATMDRSTGDTDKAFAGLQFLFDRAEVEFEFLMDGYLILEDGTLFGWDRDQIERVARQLRATPWEQLAAHYDVEQMTKEDVYPNVWRFRPEDELDWLKHAYEDLVAFFDAAAKGGYGAFMNFSF